MAQNFFPTAANIISASLRAIGVGDAEGTLSPSTTETTNALTALNYLVTSWQADGLQVWCHKTVSYTLSAASSYTIGASGATITAARPLSIIQAWLRDTSTNPIDIPVEIISRSEYNELSSKSATGMPVKLFYDPEYDRDASNNGANAKGKIYVWPTPSATEVTNYDLYMVTVRPIQDFNASSDTFDFPQYWYNAIKWGLAHELSFDYGLPVEIQDRVKAKAMEEKDRAMAFDVDQTPVFFQVDTRKNF
jgi:hypothetical protein